MADPATMLSSKAAVHAINRTHAHASSLASSNTILGKLPIEWMTPRTIPVHLGRSERRYHGRGEWATIGGDFPGWRREVFVKTIRRPPRAKRRRRAFVLTPGSGRALRNQRIVLDRWKRIVEVMKQLLPTLVFG